MRYRILSLLLLIPVALLSQNLVNPYRHATCSDCFGLVSDLIDQSGNGSDNILIRTFYNGITNGGEYDGTWSSGTAYSALNKVVYPAGSPMVWRCLSATSAGESPDTHPAKWELEQGIEMIQDLGGGVYSRYLLGIRNDILLRTNGIERGTYTTSSFARRRQYYDVIGASQITTSSSSMAIPTSHPTARTITVGTGLSWQNSATIGSSSDNFAIPTAHTTMLSINMTSGLGLVTGDYVTMYGDANNFFVYVIARYDNATGESYGGSTIHVGSGTFSSWTIKTEELIYIERTADVINKNLYALVQSYNSGTGVLTLNTLNNVGSTTNSDWTIRLAKQPFTVPASNQARYNGNQTNNPAGTYGLWHTITFVGDKLVHRSTKANNGTGWIYVYGTGEDIASPPSDVTIDTYNSTTVTNQLTTTFNNLTRGTHTVIAFSKVSANGSSTNTRPYIDAGTTVPDYSLEAHYNYDVFTADVTAGAQGAESFGEIAWNFRDSDGGDTPRWLPEHANVKTTTGTDKTLKIDDITVALNDEMDYYSMRFRSFSTANIVQNLTISHPQATGGMGFLQTYHSFDRYGLYYRFVVEWLQAGYISAGYNNMIFLGETWFNKVKAQDGSIITRPADNTSYTLSAGEESQGSYLFYSTGSSPLSDFVIGQYWPQRVRDWRVGGSNRGSPFIQDFSSTTNAKWYPFVYSGYTFSTNEITRVEGRLYAGNKGSLVLP